MNKEEIDFIESRSWYQTIEFENGIRSKGYEWCGEAAWENIATLLPTSLEGKRVLDLGCNSGLFCIKAALMGAKEVIGVDWPGWRPGWNFAEQQKFVRDYFERKYDRMLPITYHSGRMEEFLKNPDLGQFDYVLAIASIYYTEDPYMVVRRLADVADNVIVRLRDDSIIKRFRELFMRGGYIEHKVIQEKMWEKLKQQSDDFYLYHFLEEKGRDIFYHRRVKGHKEIAGTDELLDIWQLMELIGTEVPIIQYTPRIPKEFLTYIPLNKFFNLLDDNGKLTKFKLTDEQKANFDWDKLVESIEARGFLTPIIAVEIEEGGKRYYKALEGKHRLTAATMIEPLNPKYPIPCVMVTKEAKRA